MSDDDDLELRIRRARERAVPLGWSPPLSMPLSPDLVNQALVAEAVTRYLEPAQRALDACGLRELAFEVQHAANLLRDVAVCTRRIVRRTDTQHATIDHLFGGDAA